MLSVQDALTKILGSGEELTATEFVSLDCALNRVIAKEITANINVPPADNSAMDGYALNCEDVQATPTVLKISQRIPAGVSPEALIPGTAARIFTGGVLPAGADAVVMQEDCSQVEDGLTVTINTLVRSGENVRPCGQDVKQGALLFSRGHLVRPQDIGLLASVGLATIEVIKKPVVALVGTGDELIEPGLPLASGQIYNSNKYMLSALVKSLGCEVVFPTAGAVKDSLEATVKALKESSAKADLIITTGGVSVGEEDYVKPAIEQLGEIHNWKIKLKPGKPLVFARVANTTLLGLPGNPVSSLVTFLLFVAPLLRLMQGLQKYCVLPSEVPLGFEISSPRQRPEFMRVRVCNGHVEAYNNQSSGVLASTTWADALALIPEDTTLKVGDKVQVYSLHALMNQEIV